MLETGLKIFFFIFRLAASSVSDWLANCCMPQRAEMSKIHDVNSGNAVDTLSAVRPGGGRMSVEVDLLLQEAKESIEAAQNYRSELQQRLQGLSQARKQVPPPPLCTHVHGLGSTTVCPPLHNKMIPSLRGGRYDSCSPLTQLNPNWEFSLSLCAISSFLLPSRSPLQPPHPHCKQCRYFLSLWTVERAETKSGL